MTKSQFPCFPPTHYTSRIFYNAFVATKFAMTYECIVSISIGDNHFNASFPKKSSLTSASSSFASQMCQIMCGYNVKYLVQTPTFHCTCNLLVLPCSSHIGSKHTSIFQLGSTICLPLVHIFLIHILNELSSGSSNQNTQVATTSPTCIKFL